MSVLRLRLILTRLFLFLGGSRRIWSFQSAVRCFSFDFRSMTSDLFLVDVATCEKDPLRRIAFVAAFAMSNYSSTIGRIAKPFNPMLVSHSFSLSRL